MFGGTSPLSNLYIIRFFKQIAKTFLNIDSRVIDLRFSIVPFGLPSFCIAVITLIDFIYFSSSCNFFLNCYNTFCGAFCSIFNMFWLILSLSALLLFCICLIAACTSPPVNLRSGSLVNLGRFHSCWWFFW